MIWVALRKEKALLGRHRIYRQEVKPFTGKEIALLREFRGAGGHRDGECAAADRTREALEQQTATAEVLQVINSSPGDLAPVFDAMLEKATDLCDAPSGTLWRMMEDDFARRVSGAADAFAAQLRDPDSGFSTPSLASIIEGEPFVHHLDLKDTEDGVGRDSA